MARPLIISDYMLLSDVEHMREQYPGRVKAGIAGTVLLCLWGAIAGYRYEAAWQSQNQDPYMIGAQTARLRGFADALRPGSVLGYLTDAPAGSTLETAMFLSAQYTLAPRLLDKTGKHEWVLGNFTRQVDYGATGKNAGLQFQHDFGNGVVLFQRLH